MIAPMQTDEDAKAEPGSLPLVNDHGRPIDLQSVAIVLWFREWSNKRIAEALGKSQKTISGWLDKAQREGRLDPIPHPNEFGLRVDCRCIADPIRPGQRLVRVNCCESGYDHDARMHADPLPRSRKAYSPSNLKGGSGEGQADEDAGAVVAEEAPEDDRFGRRYGHRMNSRGRRR